MATLELSRICATEFQLQIQTGSEVFIANCPNPANTSAGWKKWNYSVMDGSVEKLSAINIRPSSEFRNQSSINTQSSGRLKEYLPYGSKMISSVQSDGTIVALTDLTGSKVVEPNRYVVAENSNFNNIPWKKEWFSTNGPVDVVNGTHVAKFLPTVGQKYKLNGGSETGYYVPYDPNAAADEGLHDYTNPTKDLTGDYIIYPELAALSSKSATLFPQYSTGTVQFNYISHFDGKDSEFIASFDEAKVFSNSFTCKNQYDETWSCSIESETETVEGENFVNTLSFSDARRYTNIGIHNKYVWASYKNDISYRYVAPSLYYVIIDGRIYAIQRTVSGQIIREKYALEGGIGEEARVFVNTQAGFNFEEGTLGNGIAVANVFARPQLGIAPEYLQYEYAERIAGSNKLQNLPTHKSNMFSVEIRNSGILTSPLISDDVRGKIKSSINNIIKSSVKKITPSYTQLLDVYWSGS